MNGDKPVTQAELAQQLDVPKLERLERIEKVETNLLTRIPLLGQTLGTRQKATSVLVNSFDERLGNVEDELAEICDRLKQPRY